MPAWIGCSRLSAIRVCSSSTAIEPCLRCEVRHYDCKGERKCAGTLDDPATKSCAGGEVCELESLRGWEAMRGRGGVLLADTGGGVAGPVAAVLLPVSNEHSHGRSWWLQQHDWI